AVRHGIRGLQQGPVGPRDPGIPGIHGGLPEYRSDGQRAVLDRRVPLRPEEVQGSRRRLRQAPQAVAQERQGGGGGAEEVVCPARARPARGVGRPAPVRDSRVPVGRRGAPGAGEAEEPGNRKPVERRTGNEKRCDGLLRRRSRLSFIVYRLSSPVSRKRHCKESEDTMANIKSAEKRMRQTEKRRARNRGVRSRLKSAIKNYRSAEDAKKGSELPATISEIDRARRKGVIH